MRTVAAEAARQAEELEASGELREAIEVLTRANRVEPTATLELALVRLRREAARRQTATTIVVREPILAAQTADGVFEIDAADLTVAAIRAGMAQSGCVLVRGLVATDRAQRMASGIDTAIAAFDNAAAGGTGDPGWYSPESIPDRVGEGLPDGARRRFLRERGGLLAVDSPHMLFELFELVDEVRIGSLMSDFLGERPLLSALKCTLRRVPPDLVVPGGWHQDGAFLGDRVGAFNVWLSLSRCGRDAPGLDLVPRRIDRVLASDDEATYDWSLSDRAVLAAAEGMPIVRPDFEPGDALLFDQLLVHRTAVSPTMTRERHAIEAWFFAPSAYPEGQLPILY